MARPVDGTGWICAKVPQYHLPAGWVACVLHLSVCEFVERIAGKMTRHDSDFKGRLNETLKEKGPCLTSLLQVKCLVGESFKQDLKYFTQITLLSECVVKDLNLASW